MRQSLTLVLALVVACFVPLSGRSALDLSPANGLPDVWEYVFGANGLSAGADDDGDGQTNGAEAIAGTDPKSSGDFIKLKSFSRSGLNVTVGFPARAGKRYEVQGAASLAVPFVTIPSTVPNPTIFNPNADGDLPSTFAAGTAKFFRVLVTDRDSDGDGLTDYEELKLGLNPGVADSDSDGVTDLAYVTAQLNLPDTVSIRAVESFASEDGLTPGVFEITRSRTLFSITVPYGVTGTATSGVDYVALPGTSVTLAQGVSSATLSVNPIANAALEGSESVVMTLTPPPPDLANAYTVANGTAVVIIEDSTVPAGTGLTARYYDHANTIYAHAANFGDAASYAYTRSGTTPNFTGLVVVTPTGLTADRLTTVLAAVTVTGQVKLSFNGGNLNTAVYNHQNYAVTAKNATSFTCSLPPGASLPGSSSSTGNFSIQPLHPAVIDRIDAVVNNDWAYGTPNGVTLATHGAPRLANFPDDYSASFETYLAPATTGSYRFQLDADDKARVLLDTGSGLVEILEHGWDGATTPETIGTFKVSAASYTLTAGQRYKMRVEHVETTGDARCRLQWSRALGGFANIPQAEQITQTQAATYAFNKLTTTTGTAIITLAAHGLNNGDTVTLVFSGSNLFTPVSFSGNYAVANATTNTFEVAITDPVAVPNTVAAAQGCFLENRPSSTTTGLFNKTYAGTAFAGSPLRVGVDAAVTTGNNGIWGAGTPDVGLVSPSTYINPDTFSIRWTGQVQPQFTEEYTFVVHADEGSTLKINGQTQEMQAAPSSIVGGSTYLYDNASGNTVVNHTGNAAKPGSFIVGETIRLDPSTGNLTHPNGSTYTYDSVTGLAVIDITNLTTVLPNGFGVGQIVELDPTGGTATTLANARYPITAATSNTFTVSFGSGAFATQAVSPTATINVTDNRNAVITAVHATGTGTYSYNSATGDAVVDYTSLGIPANAIVLGQSVALDPTSGNLSTLPNAFATVTAAAATTFTVSYGTSFTTGNGNVVIIAPSSGSVDPAIATAFTVNFEPAKYASASIGNMNVDVINKPLKEWSSMGNERYVRVPVVGGTRYDIQLDMYENTSYARAILYWYSPSQAKQLIPTDRLYPTSVPQAPAAHAGATEAAAVVGSAFKYLVGGTNGSSVTVSGLPGGLTYNAGVISGTATAAGDHQILLTITNGAGTSTSVLNLHVEAAVGSIVRELWTPVTGSTVSLIPTSTTATGTSSLSSLEAPSGVGPNYGARISGYITAPTAGNYYFWISASNAAELWISNDDEPVNALKRASVATGNIGPRTWSGDTKQKSPWLALEAGQRYYIEILHKAGTGTGDNLAVGWLKPGETGSAPSEVVPGNVLSPYVAPAPGSTPGTLYVATMLAQNGAVTKGVGVATFRLSDDGNVAYIKFDRQGFLTSPYNGLTGAMTDWHVHNDPYLTRASSIMFDPNAPPADSGLQADGSFKWTIPNLIGTIPKAEVVELIKQGKAYINIHTAAYLNGEIRGNFTLASGTRTFTPPPLPPPWTDDSNTDNNAPSRFLAQASFGANIAEITALRALAATGAVPASGIPASRYNTWIDNQFLVGATQHLPEVLAREYGNVFGPFDVSLSFNAWWRASMTAPDQLRQRVAFALSEIHVVSGQGPLEDNARAISDFYDTLATNAFGNFRDILVGTTLTPGMGRYLDMLRNDKPDISVGRSPNENYAREIKQLFSIGLYEMWPDGTLKLTSKDAPIDTYTQREIVGLAHVFTGWDYFYTGDFRTGFGAVADWTRPMREIPARHFTGQKRVLNNEVMPGLSTVGGQPLDPNATHITTHFNDPAYQALPAQELATVHDQLFNHPNTGPFICRQLIQRLVTANPSRDYLYRVVQKFNDNGSGVRGDMKAVIKAILLDYEARSTGQFAIPAYGKQREPIMRVAQAARALRPNNVTGTYIQSGSNLITITTSTPHLLSDGESVFLEFTDTTVVGAQPAPTTGSYVVNVNNSTQYTIEAPGWMTGTYSQSAGSSVMTITMAGHYLPGNNANVIPAAQVLPAGNKGQAYFDFTSGTAAGLAGFDQTIQTVNTSTSYDIPSAVGNSASAPSINGNASGTTFTITAPVSVSARSGGLRISRFPSSYQSTGRAGVITIDTSYGGSGAFGQQADHGLSVGDTVFLNFYGSRDTTSFNETSTENDLVYTVASVPDPNTFTVAARDVANAAMNSGNEVIAFPLKAQPLVRNGTISTRPSTFAMNNTDGDLQQTPLNSTTVFNFFLPDYKYAGTLASQGITTPEFQITSETTSMRQANFLYAGVFNPSGSTTGISSFRTGSHALVMDLSRWMNGNAANLGLGAPTTTTVPWTQNQNLSVLIDQLNTLLMAGRLPGPAKDIIKNFIATPIASIGTSPTACLVTTAVPHGLKSGDAVLVSGVTTGTYGSSLNSTTTMRVATVTGATDGSSTTFTIPVSCTLSPTAAGLTNAHVSVIPYDQGDTTPNVTDKLGRLRSIIHLILTSPDYTIQR